MPRALRYLYIYSVVTMAIEKIKKQNVSDTVFDALRQEIINRAFQTGGKLPSMAKLSEQFGVSIATIKVALQRLNALGLIETKTGQGSFVLAFNPYHYLNQMSDFLLSENEINDIAEYRLHFELTIAELAMKKAKKENFRKMELLLNQMEECRQKKDVALHGDLDYQFHLEICKATQNNIFVLVYELAGKIFHKHAVLLNEQFFKMAVKQKAGEDVHLRLFRAIRDKDAKACRKCYIEMLYFSDPETQRG